MSGGEGTEAVGSEVVLVPSLFNHELAECGGKECCALDFLICGGGR